MHEDVKYPLSLSALKLLKMATFPLRYISHMQYLFSYNGVKRRGAGSQQKTGPQKLGHFACFIF